jgi:hypothetical protein
MGYAMEDDNFDHHLLRDHHRYNDSLQYHDAAGDDHLD